MADIFVSYKRDDRSASFALAKAMRDAGHSVWIDEGIHAGASWDREIEREIHDASAVLVLWSKEARESDWVRNEARLGKQAGKLVSIRIDDCELPLEFSGVQTVDVFDLREFRQTDGWTRLLERIDLLKARGPAVISAGPPPTPRRAPSLAGSTPLSANTVLIVLVGLLLAAVVGIGTYLASRPGAESGVPGRDRQSDREASDQAADPNAGPLVVYRNSGPTGGGAPAGVGERQPPIQERPGGGLIVRFGPAGVPRDRLERALARIVEQWRQNDIGYIYVKAYAELEDSDIAASSQTRGQLVRRQLRALGVPDSAILFHASDDDGRPGWAQGATWFTDGRVEVYYTLLQEAGFTANFAD